MDILGNFAKLIGDKEKRHVRIKSDIDFSYSDITLEPLSKIEDKSSLAAPFFLKSLVILIFCILIIKAFGLQVFQGDLNQKLAEGNRIRPRIIEAMRGLITDKNGVWLARNQPSFSLAVYPSDLPKKKADRDLVFNRISEISGLPVDEIKMAVVGNGSPSEQSKRLLSLDEVILKDNISHDEALLMEQRVAGLSGVFIDKKAIRDYKSIPGLGHLLGYTGIVAPNDLANSTDYYSSDKIGKTGLEAEYEDELRGIHGVEQIEVDSKGNIVKTLANETNKEPISGSELVLNIDSNLQQKVGAALQSGIDAGKSLTGQEVIGGSAAVMDVNTGAILAMVSLPDYNNNLFASKISQSDYQKLAADPNFPMFDRSVQGTYPPGSISKIILASAGLQNGNITANTSFNTPAEIRIGDYVFPDWKDHSYESTNIERALAESNNVFFYSVGGGFDKIKGLGIDNIKKYWQFFGLGEKTGIDLPGEASGLLPDPAWKQKYKNEDWYIGDTYHVSIGQGDLLVTPLQMLRATAVIANGGRLIKPQLAKEIIDPSGKVTKEFAPVVERENFLSKSVVDTVARGMRLAVTEGSARSLNDLPVEVAGKTGTAQFLDNQKTHAWFEAYAPYDKPEIAVVVLVDGGGGGHEIAAPVAKEILNYYFSNKQ